MFIFEVVFGQHHAKVAYNVIAKNANEAIMLASATAFNSINKYTVNDVLTVERGTKIDAIG